MFRTTKPYHIVMAVAVLVMIASIVFSSISSSSSEKELEEQIRIVSDLENQIAAKSAEISASNANITNASLGLNMDRLARDNSVAQEFLKSVTTWSNYEEYSAARVTMVDTYGLSTASRFMTTFFPEYPAYDNGDGTSTNFIDHYDLSCSYRGMKSMIRSTANNMYSYFTIVTCIGNRSGNGSNFNLAVLYTIDDAGRISEFDAYTLDGYTWVN